MDSGLGLFPPEVQATLLQVANDLQLVSYVHVVSAAVFVYDFLITLGMEVQYIWPTKWGFLTGLYFLQRYLPFADIVFALLHRQFAIHPSDRYCSLNFQISGWMFTSGIAISEAILTFRVWAVWQRSNVLAITFLVMFVAAWAPGMYFQYVVFKGVQFGPSPFSSRGCFFSNGAHPLIFACWVPLMAYEFVLMIMMMFAAFRTRKETPSSLVSLVYRDGIVYYIYLFILSTANVLVILFLRPTLFDLLTALERVIYSNLTSRVILHIREHATNTALQTGAATSGFDFQSPSEGFFDTTLATGFHGRGLSGRFTPFIDGDAPGAGTQFTYPPSRVVRSMSRRQRPPSTPSASEYDTSSYYQSKAQNYEYDDYQEYHQEPLPYQRRESGEMQEEPELEKEDVEARRRQPPPSAWYATTTTRPSTPGSRTSRVPSEYYGIAM